MNHCLSIILLLLTLYTNVAAQTGRPTQSDAKESTKIALSDILGDWYPIDSLVAPKITFSQIGNSFVEIDGVKHGVGNYNFYIDHDSVHVNGSAINWPPLDCKLLLKGKNVLEIVFGEFLSGWTSSLLYKRR